MDVSRVTAGDHSSPMQLVKFTVFSLLRVHNLAKEQPKAECVDCVRTPGYRIHQRKSLKMMRISLNVSGLVHITREISLDAAEHPSFEGVSFLHSASGSTYHTFGPGSSSGYLPEGWRIS